MGFPGWLVCPIKMYFLAVTWSVLTFCFLHTSAMDTDRPNVLFIVIDDLRPSLGCYGGPIISPNIDQLAAQSAVFTNAMVQQSLCAPSRTSFLTGRRPDTTKLYDFSSYWRDAAGNYTTLPQHFKEHGYFTASIGKVFHPGIASGGNDDYPYSWSIPAYHPSTDKYIYAKVCPSIDGSLQSNAMCPIDVDKMPEKTLPDLQAFDRAAEILRNLSSAETFKDRLEDIENNGDARSHHSMKTPFFLAVGYRKPHLPWKYPKEYQTLYPLSSVEIASNPNIPDQMPSVAWEVFGRMRKGADLRTLKLPLPYGTFPLNYHGPLRQNYYAASTFMDYQVGRLLNVLEESGFADNTIIMFVGDHGWQLGEHGEWCKFSNFELATRAPLMVYIPGLTDTRWNSVKKFNLIDPLQTEKKVTDNVPRKDKKMGTKLDRYLHKNAVGAVAILDERQLYTFTEDNSTEDIELLDNAYIEDFVEFVDIFPTLADLVNITIPPICPEKSFNIDFCAEGVSFAPLIEHRMRDGISSGNSDRVTNFKRWKNATFSQYPRPRVVPEDEGSDVPHLVNITIMGYAMRTREYHYTEWIGFNHITFEGNWTDVKAKELYINAIDPDQNQNVADDIQYETLVRDLSQRLKRGWRDCLPN
ncbi:iduronate 2-sulfatase-like isoform X1 [Lytechinus pictus]|uniref:iduronate 2-sulfatase-like isoform X1 n=1 Tax=Lytechinus pictus TaxID=7653 RepID=UPI0030BA1CC2